MTNRITKRDQEQNTVWFVDNENNGMLLEPCEMSYSHNKIALQRLAEYEDKKELEEKKSLSSIDFLKMATSWHGIYMIIFYFWTQAEISETGTAVATNIDTIIAIILTSLITGWIYKKKST